MRVIAKPAFDKACLKYPNQKSAIEGVYRIQKQGAFHTPEELKKVFPSLDNFKFKDKWYVIDIGGNTLLLMAYIEFRNGTFFVKHITTHAEYDKLCRRYAKEAE